MTSTNVFAIDEKIDFLTNYASRVFDDRLVVIILGCTTTDSTIYNGYSHFVRPCVVYIIQFVWLRDGQTCFLLKATVAVLTTIHKRF